MSSLKVRNTISNILQTIIVYVLTTLMAYVLNIYHMQYDSLKMLFLLHFVMRQETSAKHRAV